MSPLIFRTQKDSNDSTEIVGVGLLGHHGKGGIPVERAAEMMPELQEKDEHGRLVLDKDGNAKPLTGPKLQAAAKRFADERGLTTENVPEEKIAELPQELGVPADPPDVREVSLAAGRRITEEIERNRSLREDAEFSREMTERGLESTLREEPVEPAKAEREEG